MRIRELYLLEHNIIIYKSLQSTFASTEFSIYFQYFRKSYSDVSLTIWNKIKKKYGLKDKYVQIVHTSVSMP